MKEYRIKICGLTSMDNLKSVLDCGVNAIGVISCSTSPRHLSLPEVKSMLKAARKWAPDVERHWVVRGVESHVLESTLSAGLACTHVQLHGDYDAEHASIVKRQGKKVVQVHPVKDSDHPTIWLETDRLLLDTPGPSGGGTGRAFDRKLLISWSPPRVQVALAGGLGRTEESQELRNLPPWVDWLDLNSGVESSPGIKNPSQIIEFTQQLAN